MTYPRRYGQSMQFRSTLITVAVAAVLSSVSATAAQPFGQELRAIADIESGNGRNMRHQVIQKGLHKGERAGGRYGLMPKTVITILNRSPKLDYKYRWLRTMEANELSDLLCEFEGLDYELAYWLWSDLRKRFNPSRTAYAWYFGSQAAALASNEEVLESEYVQHFLMLLPRARPRKTSVTAVVLSAAVVPVSTRALHIRWLRQEPVAALRRRDWYELG